MCTPRTLVGGEASHAGLIPCMEVLVPINSGEPGFKLACVHAGAHTMLLEYGYKRDGTPCYMHRDVDSMHAHVNQCRV